MTIILALRHKSVLIELYTSLSIHIQRYDMSKKEPII